jgi:hypothetical protein
MTSDDVHNALGPKACDNFLYGFKGAAVGRAGYGDVAEVGEVARRDASNSGGQQGRRGASRGRGHLLSGTCWPPGAAWATPAACRTGALRRGRPCRQVRAPGQARTGNPPNDRASWRARERPTAMSARRRLRHREN